MIDSVDMLLKLISRELGPDAADLARQSAANATLAYLTKDLPHVQALRLLDGASGSMLFEFVRSREIQANGDDIALEAHKLAPHTELVIGKPVEDRIARAWLIPVSRRIGGGQGVPGNVVIAYVSIDYLHQILKDLELGPDGSITLIRTDGIVLARRPFSTAYMGRDVSKSPLFSENLFVRSAGMYETVSVADGIPRIFAFRRLERLPLVVTVGTSKNDVVALWAGEAERDAAIAVCGVTLLLIFGIFLSREIRRRDQVEAALTQSDERLRLALRAGRMVAWERGRNSDDVTRSDNSAEVLGIGSGSLEAFVERVHPDDRNLVRAVAQGEAVDGAEYRYHRDDGTGLWLATRSIRQEARPDRVVGITFDITDRKLAEEQSWRMAHSDALTGLANRAMFQSVLGKALRDAQLNDGTVALLLVDLDDFKLVNDTHGHDAGDVMLMETAARLKAHVSDTDCAARLGGDEFAILLRDRTLEQTIETAESITHDLQRSIEYNDFTLTTRASVGLSLYPNDGDHQADLLKNADLALYAAKSQGRSRVVLYTPEMRHELERRATTARDIHAAVREGKIVPYYQPKVCLSTGAVVAFEALARWNHPTRGLLTPAAFAVAFEEPELALLIGRSMLDQIAADLRSWLDQGLPCAPVALNLSTAEFREPGLAVSLLHTLAAAGVPASLLEIEVTETVFLGRASEHVATTLRHLRDAGVRIALDDFGTGYASLTHLKQFPVHDIKIDRAFIRDVHHNRDDSAIVSALITLGRSLGLTVVAEGVESENQAALLRGMGCHQAQGYLFARPSVASRVPYLLSQRHPFRDTLSSAA
jgi:diguanylate cyclase (GGDEF)-like protein